MADIYKITTERRENGCIYRTYTGKNVNLDFVNTHPYIKKFREFHERCVSLGNVEKIQTFLILEGLN